MYQVVEATTTEVTLIYILFIGASLLIYPIAELIVNVLKRGIDQWK